MNKNKTKAPTKPNAQAKPGARLSESAKNKIIIFSLVGALLLGGIVIAMFLPLIKIIETLSAA